jgi:hypothetical protein
MSCEKTVTYKLSDNVGAEVGWVFTDRAEKKIVSKNQATI